MTHETPYRLTALLLVVTLFGISGYFRHKANREGGALNPDGGTLLAFLRLGALAAFLPFVLYLIHPGWVAWARFPAPAWMRWLGAVLTAGTVPLIFWLFHTIGSNISPSHTTREGHQLVTFGPYRYIRHPLYTFGALALSGLGLLTALWWLWVGWVLLFVFLIYRIPKEEANLLAEFGAEYRRYMQRTGKFWPKFGAKH